MERLQSEAEIGQRKVTELQHEINFDFVNKKRIKTVTFKNVSGTEVADGHSYSYFQFVPHNYIPIKDTLDGFQFQYKTKIRNIT